MTVPQLVHLHLLLDQAPKDSRKLYLHISLRAFHETGSLKIPDYIFQQTILLKPNNHL